METKVSILLWKTHLSHSASLHSARAKAFALILASSLGAFGEISKQDPNERPPAWCCAVALPCLHSKLSTIITSSFLPVLQNNNYINLCLSDKVCRKISNAISDTPFNKSGKNAVYNIYVFLK